MRNFIQTMMMPPFSPRLLLLTVLYLLPSPLVSSYHAGLRPRKQNNNIFNRQETTNNQPRNLKSKQINEAIRRGPFAVECAERLLSREVTDDNVISRDDFASFLRNYCISQDVCPNDIDLRFHHLNLLVQLAFVDPICSVLSSDKIKCLNQLVVQWGGGGPNSDYGYNITSNNRRNVEQEIIKLCGHIYTLVKNNDNDDDDSDNELVTGQGGGKN